jgi:hypothetical protein
VQEEHEPKEAAGCPKPPGEPPESLVCDDEQTATTGITFAQAIGGQGEAEACETPLPWEEEYDDTTTVEEDSNSSGIQTGRTTRTIEVYNAPTGAGSMAMVPIAAGEPQRRWRRVAQRG